MVEKLKPCPFCGGAAEMQCGDGHDIWPYYVMCVECVAEADRCKRQEDAIAAWNHRAPDAARRRGRERAPTTKGGAGELGNLFNDPPKATHRHANGSEYVLIGYGKMQAEYWLDVSQVKMVGDGIRFVNMREVAIYRSVDDGELWVRPREEFEDGRFEALSDTTKSAEVVDENR